MTSVPTVAAQSYSLEGVGGGGGGVGLGHTDVTPLHHNNAM